MEASKRFYRPELDVLRFLAFFLVYLDHILPVRPQARLTGILSGNAQIFYAAVQGAGFGLSLFFVLSAFLICELLVREQETTGTVRIKEFYLRRILRIWPLYYFALAIGTAIALLPGGERGSLVQIGWFAIFMSGISSLLYGAVHNPVWPLWSISIEEQFYAMVPWVAKYLNRKALYGFCVVVILVSNAWLVYLSRTLESAHHAWGSPIVQFEAFAAGILLCLILHGRLPKLAIWQRLLLAAVACFFWFIACYKMNILMIPDGNPGAWRLMAGYALGTLGAVLMLIAFLGVSPKLLPAWAIYLGRISFGLYVYHEFAIYLRFAVLAQYFTWGGNLSHPLKIAKTIGFEVVFPFVLTIVLASLSYRFLETPFLKMKKRHSIIESEPIATGVRSAAQEAEIAS